MGTQKRKVHQHSCSLNLLTAGSIGVPLPVSQNFPACITSCEIQLCLEIYTLCLQHLPCLCFNSIFSIIWFFTMRKSNSLLYSQYQAVPQRHLVLDMWLFYEGGSHAQGEGSSFSVFSNAWHVALWDAVRVIHYSQEGSEFSRLWSFTHTYNNFHLLCSLFVIFWRWIIVAE